MSNNYGIGRKMKRRLQQLKQTTPRAITNRILKWCQAISGETPIYLEAGTEGVQRSCQNNCLRYYVHNSGSIVPGWILWESALILEAERHTVIETLDGLRCLTPQPDGESKILFLPDYRNRGPEFKGRYLSTSENLIFPQTTPIETVRGAIKFELNVELLGQPKIDDELRNRIPPLGANDDMTDYYAFGYPSMWP
jgi:hypothetical protein